MPLLLPAVCGFETPPGRTHKDNSNEATNNKNTHTHTHTHTTSSEGRDSDAQKEKPSSFKTSKAFGGVWGVQV